MGVNRYNPDPPIPLNKETALIVNPAVVGSGLYNTQARIIPNPDYEGKLEWSGEVNILYNRYNLSEYLSGLKVPGNYSDYSSSRDVVGALSQKYYLPIARNDVTLVGVPASSTVVLTASPSSIGFYFRATLEYEG